MEERAIRVGAVIDWLMQDEQTDLFEFVVAFVLNLIFLALMALLLWPLDTLRLVWTLAKGYGLLWLVIFVTAWLLNAIQHFFRMNIYDRANAYIISNLAVSCFLQVGWAAFAALTVHTFSTGAPVWLVIILYLVGFLSCFITFWAVSSIYTGHIYKLVSMPLALVSFLVFSVWPASGRLMYGWFFRLF